MSQSGSSIRSRLTYSPIVSRPKIVLPHGKRIAVWTIVNVENWLPEGAMPRTALPPPMGLPLLPDVPNWAWHEYGMRVGFWRFLDVLGSRGIRATFAVNGSACTIYAEPCRAALDAKWEFMGHGFVQKTMHCLEDQRAAIKDAVASIADFTGRPPRGWESPGLTETDETLDLLAEAGIDYVADWVLDDQPVTLRAGGRTLVSIPYTVEINDVVISAIQHHRSDEIFLRGRDQFDRLYTESASSARVMAISIHPYLTGVPHWIKYLEALYDYIRGHEGVLFWRGEDILDWYLGEIHGPRSDLRTKQLNDDL